jgi:hypothetical protein
VEDIQHVILQSCECARDAITLGLSKSHLTLSPFRFHKFLRVLEAGCKENRPTTPRRNAAHKMGRELQKRKNRSSVPKIKLKPKSKRVNPLGNAIIAANWYAPSYL